MIHRKDNYTNNNKSQTIAVSKVNEPIKGRFIDNKFVHSHECKCTICN